jgi:ribose transport system permease protein
VPLPFLITLGVALVVMLLLRHTVLGSDIYTMSSGERALLVSGVNVVGLKVVVYTLCGLLAAIGGMMIAARLGVAAPTAAIGYEVDAVAAAVIGGASLFGGVGSTLGVLLGAAVTQMLYNGLVLLGYPSYWQTAAIGAMILLSILLDYWRRRR